MSGVILIFGIGIPLIFLSLYQTILIVNIVYAVEVNGTIFTMRRYFFNDLVLSTPFKTKFITDVRIFKSDSDVGFGYANIVMISPIRFAVVPREVLNMDALKKAWGQD